MSHTQGRALRWCSLRVCLEALVGFCFISDALYFTGIGNLVRVAERGARRAGARAAPEAALPMLPPQQPAVTRSRPSRPDRSSGRSHRAPPAASVAPRLVQRPEGRHGDRGSGRNSEVGDRGSGRSSEAGNGRVTTQGSLRKVAGDGHCLFESWQVGRDEQLGLPRGQGPARKRPSKQGLRG